MLDGRAGEGERPRKLMAQEVQEGWGQGLWAGRQQRAMTPPRWPRCAGQVHQVKQSPKLPPRPNVERGGTAEAAQ